MNNINIIFYFKKACIALNITLVVAVLVSTLGCDISPGSNSATQGGNKAIDSMYLSYASDFDLSTTNVGGDFKGHDITRIASFSYGISAAKDKYMVFILPGNYNDLFYSAQSQSFITNISKLYSGVEVLSKSFDEREYYASNAFGAKVKVKEENEVRYKIKIDKPTALAFRGTGEDDSVFRRIAPIPDSLKDAKPIEPFFKFIVIGQPIAPWYENSSVTKEATLNDANARNSLTHTLYLNLKEIWLVNTHTGDIYAKWSKAEELNSLLINHPFNVEIKYRGSSLRAYIDGKEKSESIRGRGLPEPTLFRPKHQIKIHSYNWNDRNRTSIYVNGEQIEPEWKFIEDHYETEVTRKIQSDTYFLDRVVN